MFMRVCMLCFIFTLCIRFIINASGGEKMRLDGMYTSNIKEYETLIPQKVNKNGKFVSYSLPHFYEQNQTTRLRRSLNNDKEKIHYILAFNGRNHLLEMWPHHKFVSPGMMVEERNDGAATEVSNIKIRPIRRALCHYRGRIKDHEGSRLALSVCDGLTGSIKTKQGHYFIEPVKDHVPDNSGRHLHIIYRRSPMASENACGTQHWKKGWQERIRHELYRKRDIPTNKTNQKRSSTSSEHRYLEILVVADKRFLDYHKNTDYEMYILTIMNMASDYYHDASIGNMIDFVVVRIIYLYKEDREFDLRLSRDADATLKSFCNWQYRINPSDFSHPNHHDIAVLITRYDICADKLSQCGMLGLAHVAQACNPQKSCAITEDNGLALGVTVTHEVGHVMGCGHDTEELSGCKPYADTFNTYVMSPYVQLATSIWSKCSRKFVQEFLDYDFGDCLLDEPQNHNFRDIDMPPGAMYDANFQCQQIFNRKDIEFCDQGPRLNCEELYCKLKPNSCTSDRQPPADGTSCGVNMWCFDRECVPTGRRPRAVNGQWGSWSSWSQCTRRCGGGITFSERDCNNPAPKNRGRYCLGRRREYRVCNTNSCNAKAPTFREQQCSMHNKRREKWKPYFNIEPDSICQLYCISNTNAVKIMSPRVEDGTPCKPGTKDMCIAGRCRVVGCDWIVDSNAVEDRCGKCKGDGTQCTIIEMTYRKLGKDYVIVTVIPKGSTKIFIEELKPSPNTLALAASNGNFFLNGGHTEEHDQEFRIAGTIGYYVHPEIDLERIVISGPTNADIVLYVCFNSRSNPGILYRFAKQGSYKIPRHLPNYHWEFVEWNECNKRCNEGIQVSEPSCVEETNGKVSDSFCEQSSKPAPKVRFCNQKPCVTFWRTGQWGPCNGCLNTPGVRVREVECARESPYEDEFIATDDKYCSGRKPVRTERCKSFRPCHKHKSKERTKYSDKSSRSRDKTYLICNGQRMISFVNGTSENATMHSIKNESEAKHEGKQNSNEIFQDQQKNTTGCDDTQQKDSIVKDEVPPNLLDLVEIPIVEKKNELVMSDEASEALGDKLSEVVNEKDKKEFIGEEAAKLLKGDVKESSNENATNPF